MQALVKGRRAYEEVAAQLGDETVPLDRLIETEEAAVSEPASAALRFEADIAPMFRQKDVEEMKEVADFDLSDYEDVRSHAEVIYSRLDDGTMPCDGPWPDDRIERFRRWIEQGMER